MFTVVRIGETDRKMREIPQKMSFKGFLIIFEKTGNTSKIYN